jgi:stage II sporulation protein M
LAAQGEGHLTNQAADLGAGKKGPFLGSLAARAAAFYADQWTFFNIRLKKYVKIAALIFFAAWGASWVVFWVNPHLAVVLWRDFINRFRQVHPDLKIASWGLFMEIWTNNMRVELSICFAGLLPFYAPAALAGIANASILGLALASAAALHKPVLRLFSTLILPHGLVEIPTMIFVGGFALYLSSQMTRRLRLKKWKKERPAEGLFDEFLHADPPDRIDAIGEIFWVFLGVVVPLVTLAAVLEAFVTPYIYRLFS